ncbi:MAG TPA: diguanylate cyclase [Planctomycetota bacterium]|nr:diguanylate cyclase [Planctomycetota bacterium]
MKNLYKIAFDDCIDPQYIVNFDTQKFIAVNSAFVGISGYSKAALLTRLKYSDLVPAEDLPRFKEILKRRRTKMNAERYSFQVKTKSGKIIPVEVSAHLVKLDEHYVVIGSWRDITQRHAWEKNAREKVSELALANNRILLLTEKIKDVPKLTSSFLKMPTEEHLTKNICIALCDRQQFNYEFSAIYLLDEQYLNCHYSKGIRPKAGNNGLTLRPKIDIRKNHALAKAFRNFLADRNIFWDNAKGFIILPLAGREKILGLILLRINPKEQELMESNPAAKKGYYDALKTLTNSIGLAIENIRLSEALKIQSIRDGLTGVFNRRYFEGTFTEEFLRAKRYKRRLALLFIDLDKFKTINDTYGHKQGDIILKEVAALLQRNSRKIDSVCRYGGDEFAIILPETDWKGASLKARNISTHVQTYRFTNITNPNNPFKINISIGISILSDTVNTADDMIIESDKLLFKAKKRNHHALRRPDLPSAVRSR